MSFKTACTLVPDCVLRRSFPKSNPICDFFCPQSLWECNVFSHICLSVCLFRRGPHVATCSLGNAPGPLDLFLLVCLADSLSEPLQTHIYWRAGCWPSTEKPSFIFSCYRFIYLHVFITYVVGSNKELRFKKKIRAI